MVNWTEKDIPDLTGRTAVVTGANSGLGYQTARLLAAHGARVVAGCRNRESGQAAILRIKAEQPTARIELEGLDLADLDSVTAFADRLHETLDRNDILVLNAGVMVPPEGRTKQGFELQIGVNYLGHFALAARLQDLLEEGTDPRIVAVSSTAAQSGEIHFDDLNFEHGYNAWAAYGQSKLAMQLFVLELQRRLTAAGSRVKAIAAHPGWTRTDLQRTAAFAKLVNPIVGMKPEQRVLSIVRAATDPDARGGTYYGPDGMMQMRGHPTTVPFLPNALKAEDQERLWGMSEQLTGIEYRIQPWVPGLIS